MKKSIPIILLFLFVFAANGQERYVQGRIQAEHGNYALEIGNYTDALRIFEECVQKYDSIPEALFGAAKASYYLGKNKEAGNYINAALQSKNSDFKTNPAYQQVFRYAALIEETENSPFKMVFVRGGVYTMGCNEAMDKNCEEEEKPSHNVQVGDFFIGSYEVTQAQWKKVMGSNPSGFTNCDDCPVESITWDEIQVFIEKLNKQFPALKFRLPTEEEWEFAARGGNKSKGFLYCGSNNADEVAWYQDNSGNKTHPVGQKLPNELGLYDMGGNVWEWTQNWFFFYQGQNTEAVRGAMAYSHRTDRGGCWQYSVKYVTPSKRGGLNPFEKNNDLGFRLARTAQ